MIGKRAAFGAAVMAALSCATLALAQSTQTYQQPPAPIAQILDAAPTPGVSISPDRSTLLLIGRENLPPISDLAQPFLRLAGYRINPNLNGPSEGRVAWSNSLTFQSIAEGATREVALPAGARFIYTTWSPDNQRVAFALRAERGLELWVADRSGQARRLTGPVLNAAFGMPFRWTPDGAALIALLVPEGRGAAPTAQIAPTGPLVQQNEGRTAPARTYQDLLTSPHDEALFEHYFTAQIARVDANAATVTSIGAPALYVDADPSPDGRYLLVTQVKRPFSYTSPAGQFPTEVSVWDMSGRRLHQVVDRPLADDTLPAFDAVVRGPRAIDWRSDAPATLVWAETQDGGDPARQVAVRDRIFTLAAPFRGRPRVLAEVADRYAGISWGRDDFAILYTRWFNTRNEKRFALNPSRPGALRPLLERNYQDRYNNPGSPLMRTDERGQTVIHFTPDGGGFFQAGPGATREGEFPFLDRIAIADGASQRLWRAQQGENAGYEAFIGIADAAGTTLLTRRENATTPPNFFLRPLNGEPRALTSFPDPAPQFAGVTKRQITYQRADGVTLSGTLYLPAGYDAERDGPLPTLLWAYPAEFTDAAVAGQTVDDANRFVRPGGSSHLFLLTQGYAVLDNPTMPIIGEDGAEPNDTYIEQLTASAEAAVNALAEQGVADRRCIAIGGHSYGAFMTANLLAHTDLFRTGIARSGAYNRTLTPFGFQAEQRVYWDAVETYTRMSPFTYANQINEPILLIHGEADDNTGTFPVQSERMYAALRGNGANVRYVVLPHEAHGYRARESVGHTLWEMHGWLERHVRPACAR